MAAPRHELLWVVTRRSKKMQSESRERERDYASMRRGDGDRGDDRWRPGGDSDDERPEVLRRSGDRHRDSRRDQGGAA